MDSRETNAKPRRLALQAGLNGGAGKGGKPGSVPNRLGHGHLSGMYVAAHLKQPSSSLKRAGHTRLIRALHQLGFTEPSNSRRTLVSFYLTVSPLPADITGGLFSVALSVGFTSTRGASSLWFAAQPLAGSLPCGARTFLTLSRATAFLSARKCSTSRSGRWLEGSFKRLA